MKIILVVILLFLPLLFADDWPDWRGPNRDGVWNESGIIEKFSSDHIPFKWRVPVGAGYSGPTVANGRVYLTDRIADRHVERILCFDENTGEQLWSYEYEAQYKSVGYPAGPRASVIVDGYQIYSLGAVGHLFCLDATTGKVSWQKDLDAEYDIRMPIWGIAAAPLVDGNSVYLQIGGKNGAAVVALNKLTGTEQWRAVNDEATYVAPILIKQAGKRVLVIWAVNYIYGLNPASGNVYWKIPFKQKMGMAISTPVLYKNYLFISSFFNGSMLIQLHQHKVDAQIIWQRAGQNERRTDALHCCINTPVILNNYIYGVDSYGELRCLDIETGDRVWTDTTAVEPARWANVHFVQNDDNTWMFNENGELFIRKLSPKGFSEMSRATLIEPTTEQLSRKGVGVTWAHPAFANKHVFIRNDKELICADLTR